MSDQAIFGGLGEQGDLAAMYATNFFGIENEIQMCDAQIGYDTGVAADLRWLCYAAGPSWRCGFKFQDSNSPSFPEVLINFTE